MKNKTAYLFLAAAVVFFLADTIQKLAYSPDDTFIYMQYARNIAGGHGFSFNPGEPSYGVTSPFWVIILSIPYFLGFDAFWFSKILDIICAALSVFVLFRISKRIFNDNRFYPLLAASMFTVNLWFVRWSFTGMETNLAVLMVLLVLYFYFKKNLPLSFFLCGLFFLIRPEGFVLFLVILICVFAGKQFKSELKNSVLYLVLFAISIVPYLIYSRITFGTFLANTTLGKSTLTFSLHTVAAQVTGIIKTLAPSSGLEILLSLFYIAMAWKSKLLKQYLVFVLWPAGLLLLYVITDSDIISRYFLIIIPVFTVMAVKTVEMIKTKYGHLIGTALFAVVLILSQFFFYEYVKPAADNFSVGVKDCLIPVGKWISANTPPDSRILVNDVGAIGYYSNRYIIDAAALINRDLMLNKEIMSTPLEQRKHPYNLLKFINADYVIERDSVLDGSTLAVDGKRLELQFHRLFPGLGISDNTPKYYKVYKVSAN